MADKELTQDIRTITMRAHIKQSWVHALMSGDYKQGKGRLHNIHGEMCCLGVLTDLAVKANCGRWGDKLDSSISIAYIGPGGSGERFALHDSVINWAGIRETNHVEYFRLTDPLLFLGGHHLSVYNDSRGLNFKKIAVLIEQHIGSY